MVSNEMVEKLGLNYEAHPHLYHISLFIKGNNVTINKRYLVKFSIKKSYYDEIWYDAIPIMHAIYY